LRAGSLLSFLVHRYEGAPLFLFAFGEREEEPSLFAEVKKRGRNLSLDNLGKKRRQHSG
jgi:hypothetical protein